MNALKQSLLYNWHIARIIRLVLGVWILVWSIQTADWAVGLLSLFFVITALTNTGCCGAQSCAIPYNKPTQNTQSDAQQIKQIH